LACTIFSNPSGLEPTTSAEVKISPDAMLTNFSFETSEANGFFMLLITVSLIFKTFFMSSFCESAFSEEGTLEVHTKVHTREKPFECDLCELAFSRKDNLKNHQSVHTGEKPYKCDLCELAFSRKDNLKNHQRVHTGEKPFKCDLCGSAFSDKSTLKNHKRIHTGKKPFKCELCESAFSQKGILKNHQRVHTGEKPFKCNLCESAFSDKSTLKNHQRIHTGEKPYKCDLCESAFSVECALRKHKRVHTGEKPFKCDLCDSAFSDKSNLKTHRRIHTGEKPYKCDLCEAAFSQRNHLTHHQRIHTGEKPFKCDLCESAFSVKSGLRNHKRVHTGEKPFKCDFCESAFSDRSSLRYHKRVHTGEKPFKCDLCELAFSTKATLKKHQLIHTGEKNHKCDFCNAAFSHHGHLTIHRRIHTGETPFKCDLCESAFSVKRSLTIHGRIHTGEKPFECDLCESAFSQKGKLKYHKIIHTGEKPFKCDLHLKLHQSSLIVGQIEAAVDTVIYKSTGPHTPVSCAFLCLFELNCRSFFHVELIGHCQIHDVVLDVLKEPSMQTGSRYYVVNVQTDVDCGNPPEVECFGLSTSGTRAGDTATYECLSSTSTSTQTCTDDGQWRGDLQICNCDCRDLFEIGLKKSGVYPISIRDLGRTLIYCDMEQDGGGWSVIQRTLDDELDFNRTLNGYKRMFGKPDSSYWIGLMQMTRLTSAPSEVLLTFSVHPELTQHKLHYSAFNTGGGKNQFIVTVSGYMTDSSWEDVFSEQTGQPFSALGDALENGEDCAQQTGGGWWYKTCSSLSLNGNNASITKPSSSQCFRVAPPTVLKIRRV
ncbi:hypothetical protein ScPMuIL_016732, partial [Solemya velum]